MLRPAILALTLLGACAEVTAVRVHEGNPTPNGLPLYGHKPILIVSGGGARVETIPNLSERYAVRLNAFLAANDSTVEYNSNGTLAKIDANLDSTEAIALFEKLLDKVPTVDTTSDQPAQGRGVQVYDFVFEEDGTVSLKLLTSASVAVTTPPLPTGQRGPAPRGSVQPGTGQ